MTSPSPSSANVVPTTTRGTPSSRRSRPKRLRAGRSRRAGPTAPSVIDDGDRDEERRRGRGTGAVASRTSLADAERIWPHERLRRDPRRGATGVHVARDAREDRRARGRRRRRARRERVVAAARTRPREPSLDGGAEEVGRARAEDARRSAPRSSGRSSPRTTRSAASTGVFRFGPVGPLKNAFWSSPQRPSNAIQGYAFTAAAGSLGIVSTTRRELPVRPSGVVAADARLG